MKKVLLITCILLGSNEAKSQNFIEVQEFNTIFSKDFAAKIDIGKGLNWIRDEKGKKKKFLSSMDLLNYMSEQGYLPYCVNGHVFLLTKKENQ